ncbi:hypothetical protein HRbin26_02415 [bacterium HR26]|nr:hypothetical protein HRbin26_02415 [bacterium HR26]
MGGDILLAHGCERILTGGMALIGLERAMGKAAWVVALGCRVAIVEDQDVAALQGVSDLRDPGLDLQVDLGHLPLVRADAGFCQVGGERGRRGRAGDLDEAPTFPADVELQELAGPASHPVHRERVEEFVRHRRSGDRGRAHRLVQEVLETGSGQATGEFVQGNRAAFHRLVAERVEQRRAVAGQALQQGDRERAGAGAVLAQGERIGAAEQAPELVELPGECPAEDRVDLRRSEEVAATPGAEGRVVIAVLRVIERQLHEAGKGDRPVPLDLGADQLDQPRVAIHPCFGHRRCLSLAQV